MGNEEEQEQRKRWWYTMRREAGKKIYDKLNPQLLDMVRLSADEEEIAMERNDVYIYKTLRYPPKSTPPSVT